jgi:hypothetical protein
MSLPYRTTFASTHREAIHRKVAVNAGIPGEASSHLSPTLVTTEAVRFFFCQSLCQGASEVNSVARFSEQCRTIDQFFHD